MGCSACRSVDDAGIEEDGARWSRIRDRVCGEDHGCTGVGAALLGGEDDPIRTESGAYFTGIVYPNRIVFPAEECSAYTGAAVILAADAISNATPASAIFLDSSVID
ncbi:MAG: hypothetical protein EBY96_06600 [Actinobacteria bacterium]|nr:hypothetical protein [Actinomycetota bacterium]